MTKGHPMKFCPFAVNGTERLECVPHACMLGYEDHPYCVLRELVAIAQDTDLLQAMVDKIAASYERGDED